MEYEVITAQTVYERYYNIEAESPQEAANVVRRALKREEELPPSAESGRGDDEEVIEVQTA